MKTKHGLGKGLGALLKDEQDSSSEGSQAASRIPVNLIKRNRHQPRRHFDEDALNELSSSIREHGILQPLLVKKQEDGYELIAGERRLVAATRAGIEQVPAIVVEAEEQDSLELALVENLQRENLNPLEEALGYKELSNRFGLTQDQVARRVGKARASVANALRLLSLPEETQALISEGKLSSGHAKALTAVESSSEQIFLARKVVSENLSVRNLEKLIARGRKTPRKPRAQKSDIPAEHLDYLTELMHKQFATSVRIQPCKTYANGKKKAGSLQIDFYSPDELDRILSTIGLDDT